MSRSAQLGLCDLRAVHHLVGECRELGDDPILWRRRLLGADASIFCMRPIPGALDDYNVLYLLRPVGERDFAGRDRAIAAEAMALVGPLLGGPLARFHEPAPSALPPRVRAVLRCLLEGDSDKQIAARLRISRYTVNQYTKTA